MNLCSLVFLNKYLKSPIILFFPSNPLITPTDSICNLDFIFDWSLTFSKQNSSLSSSCNYHIRDLRRIRHTLDLKSASAIATSLTYSKLDCCNSLYLNLPQNKYLVSSYCKTPFLALCLEPQNWKHHLCTQISEQAENRRAHPLQNHLSHLWPTPYFVTQYIRKLINIQSPGSTRSSDHLTLLYS